MKVKARLGNLREGENVVSGWMGSVAEVWFGKMMGLAMG